MFRMVAPRSPHSTRFPSLDGNGTPHPHIREAAKAGEILRAKVNPATPLTVADAAAQSGLPLRDAESGLTWLSTEYRGQLRVTAEGELVHVFPTGFTKPWERVDALRAAVAATGRAVMGALRFLVRAWVAIVLVGYAAIFVGLLIAMTFARQGSDSRDRGGLPGGAMAAGLLRVLADALFWTFHPWSPFAIGYGGYGGAGWGRQDAWGGPDVAAQRRARRDEGPRVPLYERVNRFFFGPPETPEDPLESERLVVAAIRAGKGRIGLADVMRVTGLPRDEADPMMARLMLDYEGDVAVSEDGGIFYTFQALRKTATEGPEREPAPAWSRVKPLPPFTGNGLGANLAVGGINLFNLLMGGWAIEHGMTIERVVHLFDRVPLRHPIVDTGMPIALGLVPLVFSAFIFLVPIARAIARPARARAAREEKGRLAVVREVLEGVKAKRPVTDATAAQAWTGATGQAPGSKRLDRELVALGGDVAIEDSGATRWRFVDLETEAAAVEAEREAAAEDEARLGEIVYATDAAKTN
jgi:hypothetical protein